MAYIIPGIPPKPAPDAPGLLSPRGIAASLARSTYTARLVAERLQWAKLALAADAEEAACRAHPIPAPHPHRFYPDQIVTPTRCTCYLDGPATRAAMAWRSNFCSHCGGEGTCHPGCEALDARH